MKYQILFKSKDKMGFLVKKLTAVCQGLYKQRKNEIYLVLLNDK